MIYFQENKITLYNFITLDVSDLFLGNPTFVKKSIKNYFLCAYSFTLLYLFKFNIVSRFVFNSWWIQNIAGDQARRRKNNMNTLWQWYTFYTLGKAIMNLKTTELYQYHITHLLKSEEWRHYSASLRNHVLYFQFPACIHEHHGFQVTTHLFPNFFSNHPNLIIG